ncbi:hypothetical protein FO675_10950 [Riemerella anatipestifer]|uniref:hypothetical protein n=1 Tax=Riemerella anatipestifer TaxID=34085 RepID=UPI001AD6BEBC|nr:hypothetical protein [Riemerella anatipestifer]MBO4234796.1 hypothetical protein [Riemerella anatipestifer]
MQLQKARELQQMWGNKPCDHKELEKEYFNSTATGDYACRVCGKAFWNGEKTDEDQKGKNKKDEQGKEEKK